MSLDAYTDQQLMDELLNRRMERELADDGNPPTYCDNCAHFVTWDQRKPKRRTDKLDDYNPCSLRHTMRFKVPEEWEGPHADYGYYRRACSDRKEIQPPEPEIGVPGWKPRTV